MTDKTMYYVLYVTCRATSAWSYSSATASTMVLYYSVCLIFMPITTLISQHF